MQINTKQDVAKALLELFGPDGEHWTQGALARNADGVRCEEFQPEAVCFCLVGGVYRLEMPREVRYDFLNCFEALGNPDFPAHFNDTHTWPEVKARLESIANGN